MAVDDRGWMGNSHGLVKGDVLWLNLGEHPLDGIKASYVRQSPRTSECTVELLEDRGAYKKGDRIQVKQWEMS